MIPLNSEALVNFPVYPQIPNEEGFHGLVGRLREMEALITNHNASFAGGWPKALDLGYLAVHYSGGIAWSCHSVTGGMSVATRVGLAEDYLKNAVSGLWAPMGYSYGFSSTHGHPPTSKVLAFVGARDVSCIRNPKHMYSEGENEERIMTSVHLSDFDPGTQKLVREIFGETRDPEYIEQ